MEILLGMQALWLNLRRSTALARSALLRTKMLMHRAWMQRTGGSQIFTDCLRPAVSLPDLCGSGRLDGSCDAMA